MTPITCRWVGDGFEPLNSYWAKEADSIFVVGEVYHLEAHEDRSAKSHSHQFAWLHNAWRNLPERYADNFPTAEHLRKRALIEAGYYDEEIIDAGSNAAALRVASYVRKHQDFALVIVRKGIVFVRSAKSQSRRAMNKAEFQASKSAILDIIAGMLGLTPGQLARAA